MNVVCIKWNCPPWGTYYVYIIYIKATIHSNQSDYAHTQLPANLTFQGITSCTMYNIFSKQNNYNVFLCFLSDTSIAIIICIAKIHCLLLKFRILLQILGCNFTGYDNILRVITFILTSLPIATNCHSSLGRANLAMPRPKKHLLLGS